MIRADEEIQISLSDVQRIRKNCDKKATSTSGCVVWLDEKRKPMKRRRAQVRLRKNRRVSVSKALYEAEFGKIAENNEVIYCSLNDECVNPHHAEVKTKKSESE